MLELENFSLGQSSSFRRVISVNILTLRLRKVKGGEGAPAPNCSIPTIHPSPLATILLCGAYLWAAMRSMVLGCHVGCLWTTMWDLFVGCHAGHVCRLACGACLWAPTWHLSVGFHVKLVCGLPCKTCLWAAMWDLFVGCYVGSICGLLCGISLRAAM